MARILIIGSAGYVGSRLLPKLVEAGHEIYAASRELEKLEQFNWPAYTPLQLDLLDPESLKSLPEVDYVYFLMHGMAQHQGIAQREQTAAQNLLDALDGQMVHRIFFLSALQHPDSDSAHLKARALTGQTLANGPFPVTELRAGIVVGSGSAAFEVMRDLVYNLPAMVTPRWVRSKMPPLALKNLLYYMVHLPECELTGNQVMDLAGPETLSYQEMMQQFARHVGRRCPIFPVPLLTPTLSSYWLKLITSVPTPLARSLIDGLKTDLPADDSAIRAILPQDLLTFEQALQQAFEDDGDIDRQAGLSTIRASNPECGYYPKQIIVSREMKHSADEIWQQLRQIGGEKGYFFADILWQIRGWIDALFGGQGHRHYRRHPVEIEVGDRIDSWKVLEVEPARWLNLLFQMKGPGVGRLTFEQANKPEGSHITVTASWHPKGVWGLLYWYTMWPAHKLLFIGMLHQLDRQTDK